VTHTGILFGQRRRLVAPAKLRHSLGFEPGDKLHVRTENGRLVLEKTETIKARLLGRFADVPPTVSLVDEVIAGRRAEARQE